MRCQISPDWLVDGLSADDSDIPCKLQIELRIGLAVAHPPIFPRVGRDGSAR